MDAKHPGRDGNKSKKGITIRMPWTAKYNAGLHAVEVISRGDLSPEDLRTQIVESIRLGWEHATDRLLIDDEQLTSAFSAIDLVSLVDAYAEMGLSQRTRIAVLLPTSPHSARTMQFYETAARNRAYNLRVFPGRVAAQLWLVMEQDSCPSRLDPPTATTRLRP